MSIILLEALEVSGIILQLSVIRLFAGIESRPSWGLTDAAQTGNFPICKLTLGRKRNHSVMVERGGRKRDGWRDGRGWYRAGGRKRQREGGGREGTVAAANEEPSRGSWG